MKAGNACSLWAAAGLRPASDIQEVSKAKKVSDIMSEACQMTEVSDADRQMTPVKLEACDVTDERGVTGLRTEDVR